MALTQVKTAGIAADAVTGAKVADDQIDSEHYIAASIDNEHLADNAVGLAEMAHGTDGNLITYDTNGAPAHVTTGSSGQVLTSNGAGAAPTFQAASAGATLSGSTDNTIVTVTGSNAMQGEANLTFDGNNLNQTIDADNEGFKQTAAGNHYIGNIANADITSGAGYAVYIQTGQWDGNQIAQMRFICGDDTTNKDDGDIAFYTSAGGSSSEVLRLTQEKNVEIADGNLKFASGHGIDFSATSNFGTSTPNELLEDYEEGTWTPSDGGGIVSYAEAYGQYTKIGRAVYLWFKITCTSSVTDSGNAYIVGLPFTSENAEATGHGALAIGGSNSTDNFMSASTNKNSTVLYLYKDTYGDNMTRAQMWDGASTTKRLTGCFMYCTSS